MIKNTKNNNSHNASIMHWLTLFAFVMLAYFFRPMPLPDITPESILQLTGKPEFLHTGGSKSAGSGTYFDVSGNRIYCGIGDIQGENSCELFEDAIDKNREVTIRYFLMPSRFGFKYPILYSLAQGGVQIVSPQMARTSIEISLKLSWKSYHFKLLMFVFTALIIFAANKLETISPSKQG
jgi:hypothetical protein